MLKARNLDDQTYEEIVKGAEGRLPWLCPAWTDHNAHDPGITVLELMAWYKELQQYHMNQLTDGLKWKLLKLAGVHPRPAAPAACAVELEPGSPARLPLARLATREGIPFELDEAVPARRPVIARVCVAREEGAADVGELLGGRPITFQPFGGPEGPCSALRVAFSQLGEGALRLWFEVVPPEGVPRSPFEAPDQAPRVLRWICEGAADTVLVRDDTHGLSVSGYVVLRPEGDWPAGPDGLYWLRVVLEDPGCEECVRLSGLTADRWPAVQRETWARSHRFRAEARPDWTVLLADAQARDGELAVFLRTSDRWEQTGRWQSAATQDGRLLQADTAGAVQDGGDNVLVISLDAGHSGQLLFDARGLPGETFFLDLEGRTALTEDFTLLCDTLDRDGQVRPALWRCVDDLHACGPRDRVFTYDPVREAITFGDGEHGALLRRGKGAVLAASLTLSRCGGGNIPGGTPIAFSDDGLTARSTAASGGRERETVEQAQARLLQALSTTQKCVCAADYERLALTTPGLRVAAAKALPAYDPDEPTGVSRMPCVTVVVVPDGAGGRPLPDRRFLEAVQRRLDAARPIGTQVKVVPPVYVDLDADVALRGGEDGDVRLALERWLAAAGIGGGLRTGDAAARVQAAPGVLQVRRVSIHTASAGCYQNAEGDIRLPPRAIPRLRTLRTAYLPTEGPVR